MKKLLLFCLTFALFSFSHAQINLGKKINKIGKGIGKKSKMEPSTMFVSGRSPGGLAYDPLSKQLFAYATNSLVIDRYKTNGQIAPEEKTPYETVFKTALNSYDKPAKTTSLGLDFAPISFQLGEKTTVPKNSLLIFNGEERTREITVVNKSTGAVITGMDIANGRYVGGVFHPTQKHFFLIDSASDDIIELDPKTGDEVSRFDINNGASRALNIYGGAIEVNDKTGNLFVVTDGPIVIREFTTNGTFVQDYDLDGLLEKPALIQAITSLTFDDQGNLWIGSTGGRRISLFKELIKD